MRDVLRVLQDLVGIPSLNPMGRPLSGPEYLETQVGEYVADFLRQAGLDVEVQPILPGRSNVIARLPLKGSPTVLLESHMDTVLVDHMAIAPFDPAIRDGRLYGRGSCDTKASLAAMLCAVTEIAAQGRQRSVGVIFAATIDEEYRFTGADRLMTHGIRADWGITGEPTELDIVNAHKGTLRWYLNTTGRAAHSAYPRAGENAIYRMAPILSALEEHAEALLRRPPHPVLGAPTLSVGIIAGGQTVNTVPDECRIEIDRRLLPDEDWRTVLDEVKACLPDAPWWSCEEPYMAVQGIDVPESEPIVQRLRKACQAIGREPAVRGVAYGTNACRYVPDGIRCIVFGPGNVLRAHAAVEYVETDQVEQAVAAYVHFLTH